MTEKFIRVYPESLRKPYGYRRISFKLNLTELTHRALGSAGIIRRKESKDKKTNVAEKGGYGSAFIEFCTEIVLFLMLKQSFPKEKPVRYVVNVLETLLNNNTEAIEEFCANLDFLRLALLNEHRNERWVDGPKPAPEITSNIEGVVFAEIAEEKLETE